MNINLWNILIPAAAGILGVIIGSLKPLFDWHIEKRKLLREERKKFLFDIRNHITSKTFVPIQFASTINYSRLKPHLSDDLIRDIEFQGVATEIILGNVTIETPYRLLQEIVALERKWGLL